MAVWFNNEFSNKALRKTADKALNKNKHFNIAKQLVVWVFLVVTQLAAASAGNPPFNAFNHLSQIDALLQYWGEEAGSNITNRAGSRDARSGLFNSSIDWHSSVHGHFAAIYAGTTLDNAFIANRAVSQYTNYNITREQYFSSSHERYYGYPWLLLYGDYLAETKPALYNKLKPIITKAYGSVINQIQSLNYTKYARSVGSGYRNYNFMLFALYSYAQQIGDSSTANLAKSRLSYYAPYIDWQRIGAGDFMAPKAIAALAYHKMGLTGTVWRKLDAAYRNDLLRTPNMAALAAHAKGRVMTQAWGAWVMYERSKDSRYRDAYIRLINAVYHDMNRAVYRGDYFQQVGHWVPHFGVFALKLAKDVNLEQPDEPETPDPEKPDPEKPAIKLIDSVTVTPTTFTSSVNITYPCPADGTRVRFDIMNWANRAVRSTAFICNERNNLTANFANLSGLWAGSYRIKVTVANRQYYSQPVRRKFSWFGWSMF